MARTFAANSSGQRGTSTERANTAQEEDIYEAVVAQSSV
jgi:hypothetical protein